MSSHQIGSGSLLQITLCRLQLIFLCMTKTMITKEENSFSRRTPVSCQLINGAEAMLGQTKLRFTCVTIELQLT